MKKTYFSPELETIELKFSQHLLDGSVPEEVPGDGGNGDNVPD